MDAQQQAAPIAPAMPRLLSIKLANHEDRPLVEVEAGISAADLEVAIVAMLEADVPAEVIKDKVLPDLGVLKESIPQSIFELLE